MAGYIIYSLDWDKFQAFVNRPTPGQLAALAQLVSDALEEDELEEGDPILQWPTDPTALGQAAAKRLALPDWYSDLSSSGKRLWESVVFRACMDCEGIDVGFRADSDGVYWDVIELAWKRLKVVPNQISDVALSTFGSRPYRYDPRPKTVKSREEYDQGEAGRRASLEGLGNVLNQFLQGVKQGEDPNKLLERLSRQEGVSPKHLKELKGMLNDDEDEDEDDEDSDFGEFTPMHSMHPPEEVRKMLSELRSIDAAMRKAKQEDVRQQYEEELLPALESVAGEGRMLFIQVDT